MRGNFLKCGDGAFIAFNCDDAASAERKQCARKPARTRSISTIVMFSSGSPPARHARLD